MYMGMQKKAMKKLQKEQDEEEKMRYFLDLFILIPYRVFKVYGDSSNNRKLMESIFINKEYEKKDQRKKKRERLRIMKSKQTGILKLSNKFIRENLD